MKIGFTGTRKGMNPIQKSLINLFISGWYKSITNAHHGDCIGADSDFHKIARSHKIPITIHPSNLNTRAHNTDAELVLVERPPLVRDHDIVDAVDIMLATPKGMVEERRSGTWATIRYTIKSGKPLFIVYPDGATVLIDIKALWNTIKGI